MANMSYGSCHLHPYGDIMMFRKFAASFNARYRSLTTVLEILIFFQPYITNAHE